MPNEESMKLVRIFPKYLQQISEKNDESYDIIFYSDNCCGQNKNKFIAALYLYVVANLNINNITHKFLIEGHTQNEGDNILIV